MLDLEALKNNVAAKEGAPSVYLLYWYKSTSTDAEGAAERVLPLPSFSTVMLTYAHAC
jgi:hypothetical protein